MKTDDVSELLDKATPLRTAIDVKRAMLVIKNATDLDRLNSGIFSLYSNGNDNLAKQLWLLLYFSGNNNSFGRHEIFDSIGVRLSEEMDSALCIFARSAYRTIRHSLTEKESAWWLDNLRGWGCTIDS